MNVITKSQISGLKNDQEFNGIILIKEYAEKTTKNGKPYIEGVLQGGIPISFKCWSTSSAFNTMTSFDYNSVIALVTGRAQEYQGLISIILDSVTAVDGYSEDLFLEKRYDKESYFSSFNALLNQNLTPNGVACMDKLLFSNQELVERFKTEFAGKVMHDPCLSGLMAHTVKMLSVLCWVTSTYPELTKADENLTHEQKKDLLFIGVALHDVGKTKEMLLGVYQPNSCATHRLFGVELLAQHKDEVVTLYNEKWYYDLMCILAQHHGEFDDKCRTVYALVVHIIDMFDCRLEGMSEVMRVKKQADTTGNKIWFDGSTLSI